MNKTINQIGNMLDRRRIPYQLRQDNENVLRFQLRLPQSGADVIFMISFIEQQSNFNLSVSRIARFNAPTMDGGAGTNTMRIFSNGTWNTVYADGSSSNGTYTASDSEIAFNDEYGNTMTYESGNLVDQAGYAWIKSSAVPY